MTITASHTAIAAVEAEKAAHAAARCRNMANEIGDEEMAADFEDLENKANAARAGLDGIRSLAERLDASLLRKRLEAPAEPLHALIQRAVAQAADRPALRGLFDGPAAERLWRAARITKQVTYAREIKFEPGDTALLQSSVTDSPGRISAWSFRTARLVSVPINAVVWG
jgi:hypothetical protein